MKNDTWQPSTPPKGSPQDWRTWSPEEIGTWVAQQGDHYAKYQQSFVTSEIEIGLELQDLDDELLRDMIGMENQLYRKRLLGRIQRLVSGRTPPPCPSPTSSPSSGRTQTGTSPTPVLVVENSRELGARGSLEKERSPLASARDSTFRALFGPLQHLTQDPLRFLSNFADLGMEELDTQSDYVGLFFGAHWCEDCARFTPKMVQAYQQVKSVMEVVFVPFKNDSSHGQHKSNEEFLR
jgi:hypothetical protein